MGADRVHDDPGVRLAPVGGERGVGGAIDDVGPVGGGGLGGLGGPPGIVGDDHRTDAATQAGREVDGLRDQLGRHLGEVAVDQLRDDPQRRLAVEGVTGRRGLTRVLGGSVTGFERPQRAQLVDEVVEVEPVAHHPARVVRQRGGLDVRDLRRRRLEPDAVGTEAQVGRGQALDGGSLGPTAPRQRGIAGQEARLRDGAQRRQRQGEALVAALDDPPGDQPPPVELEAVAPRGLREPEALRHLRAHLAGLAVDGGEPREHQVGAAERGHGGSQRVGRRPRVRPGEGPIAQQHPPIGTACDGVPQHLLGPRRPHAHRPHLVTEP